MSRLYRSPQVKQLLQQFKAKPNTIQSISIKGTNYVGHLLIISNPAKVHVAYSNQLGVKGEKLKTVMSANSNLIAGINAGGFVNDQSTGGVPLGLIISRGSLIFGEKTTSSNMIGITSSGVLTLGTYTPQQALTMGITEAVTFKAISDCQWTSHDHLRQRRLGYRAPHRHRANQRR